MAKIPSKYLKSSLVNKINIHFFGTFANYIFVFKHFLITHLLFLAERYIKLSQKSAKHVYSIGILLPKTKKRER